MSQRVRAVPHIANYAKLLKARLSPDFEVPLSFVLDTTPLFWSELHDFNCFLVDPLVARCQVSFVAILFSPVSRLFGSLLVPFLLHRFPSRLTFSSVVRVAYFMDFRSKFA